MHFTFHLKRHKPQRESKFIQKGKIIPIQCWARTQRTWYRQAKGNTLWNEAAILRELSILNRAIFRDLQELNAYTLLSDDISTLLAIYSSLPFCFLPSSSFFLNSLSNWRWEFFHYQKSEEGERGGWIFLKFWDPWRWNFSTVKCSQKFHLRRKKRYWHAAVFGFFKKFFICLGTFRGIKNLRANIEELRIRIRRWMHLLTTIALF